MTNEARGEFEIELEGVSYGMRPSYDAIDEYEAATGKSTKLLVYAVLNEALKKKEMAVIVGACVRAWGRSKADNAVASFKNERIGELLSEQPGGLDLISIRLGRMLTDATTGGITSSGERKPIPTMKE